MNNQSAQSLALPPGSFGLPVVGETISFLQDSQQFALTRHNQYGPIFKTHIFGRPTLFVRGAEVRFVLTNENKYFANSLPPTTKALLGDRSLSLQMGGVHTQRRKFLYQAFQARILEGYISKMEDITEQYLQRWAALGSFTWYPELRSYTFDIACHFLVGLEKASETPLRDLFEVWSAGLFSVPLPLPWTRFGRALHARKQLLEFLEEIILQRQHQGEDAPLDALQLLLQARDEEGKGLEIEEIKDQVLTLLFAGHETLTSALASFCLVVAQHREVLERCRAEQHSLGASELNLETLARMSYLEQVLKEVLRLVPPVGGGFREVIQPCEFNGYQIPQGWNVLYQIYSTHQDASIYSSPEQFEPERFSGSRSEESKPMGYVPFGGGARECIGKEFARLEMKLFAARLVRDYDWELPEQNLDLDPIPVPHPRDGLKVNFRMSV